MKRKMRVLAVLGALAFSATTTASDAPPADATAVRIESSSPHLRWKHQAAAVKAVVLEDDVPHAIVELEGTYSREGWKIARAETPARIAAKLEAARGNGIRLRVPLTGPRQELRLVETGPEGKEETIVVSLALPEGASWDKLVTERLRRARRPWKLIGSLGYALNRLEQGDRRAIEQNELSAKFSFSYRFGSKARSRPWHAGITGYGTVAPLSTLPSSGGGMRYLGLNLRGGRVFALAGSWWFGIDAGFYYTTMLTSGREFGFRDLSGPQVFPTFGKRFSASLQASAYFKFSPVSDRLSVLALSNHEIAAGLSVEYRMWQDVALVAALDHSRINLELGQSAIGNTATVFSLGAAY